MISDDIGQHDLAYEACACDFSFYTPEEVERISVKRIVHAELFDAVGNPLPGGLYDPAFGPLDKLAGCVTCEKIYKHCPGHFGHVELPEPLFHPLLLPDLLYLLNSTCIHCHKILLSFHMLSAVMEELRLLDCGDLCGARLLKSYSQHRFDGTDGCENSVRSEEDIFSVENAPFVTSSSSSTLCADSAVMHERKRVVHRFLDLARKCRRCPFCEKSCYSIRVDEYKSRLFIDGPRSDGMKKPSNEGGTSNANSSKKKGRKRTRTEKQSRKSSKKRSTAARGEEKEAENSGDAYHNETSEKLNENQEVPSSVSEKQEANAQSPSLETRVFLTPLVIQQHLGLLWNREDSHGVFARSLFQSTAAAGQDYRFFFLKALLIPPSRFRPGVEVAGRISEHPNTVYYQRILLLSNELILGQARSSTLERIGKRKRHRTAERSRQELLVVMQRTLTSLISGTDARQPMSIRALLEKKKGLFRGHLMGKRVNFAARSVISPDPMLDTNEIGLPLVFALKLTYPEPVSALNYERLRIAVENGPDVYPGAVMVEDEYERLIVLPHGLSGADQRRVSEARRLLTVAPNAPRSYKTVHRHIIDGDVALVNRQPTLHKPGIMGHLVRVLPTERTIRLNYVNCFTYNADFDGDEMNIHIPQNEVARAEALAIAFADRQYTDPKGGTPLRCFHPINFCSMENNLQQYSRVRGLIQDNVIAGVLLSKRDTFLSRHCFQQLIYSAAWNVYSNRRISTPVPAILKPQRLWTGKQVVSALLTHLIGKRPPISLECPSKVPCNIWGRGGSMDRVASFPSKSNTLNSVSADEMMKVWPGAGDGLVTVSSNEFLAGVLDRNQFGTSPFGLVHSCHELYGSRVAGQLLGVLGRLFLQFLQARNAFTCGLDDAFLQPRAEKLRRLLLHAADETGREVVHDFVMESYPDISPTEGLRYIMRDSSESARLDSAVNSAVNKLSSGIIKACIPDGQAKKFPDNCISLMTVSGAKGSVVNHSQISCLLGQQELEGRRPPVMVSGKSLPAFSAFDPSPRAGGFISQRFLTGLKPQEFFFHCMAGREGLVDTAIKTSRSGYLQLLEGLCVHYDYTVRDPAGSVVQFNYGEDALDVSQTLYLHRFKFWAENFSAVSRRLKSQQASQYFSRKATYAVRKEMKNALSYSESFDPVMSKYWPSENPAVVSERFYTALDKYIADDLDGLFSGKKSLIPPNRFRGLMFLKYQRSLVQPGDSVGILAAQSIGEPSTQMTLNTFHLAGRGEINVTLGVPRLRELLMVASRKQKTPLMTIHLRRPSSHEDASAVAHLLSTFRLEDLVEDFAVTESVFLRKGETGRRIYTVLIKCWSDFRELLTLHHVRSRNVFASTLRSFQKVLQKELTCQIHKAEVPVEFEWKSVGTGRGEEPKVGDDMERDSTDRMAVFGADSTSESESEHSEEGDLEYIEENRGIFADNESDAGLLLQLADGDVGEEGPFVKDSRSLVADHIAEGEPGTRVDLAKEKKTEDWGELSWNSDAFETRIELPLSRQVNMLELVKRSLHSLVLKESPGISSCTVLPSESSAEQMRYTVQTGGVNLRAVAELGDLIDFNHIQCNSVYDVLEFFGVEAARNVLVKEVASLFSLYGIRVDLRHLGLIADFMTVDGTYRSLNRIGIAEGNSSPWQKISFETAVTFLKRSALYGNSDSLITPSASLIMGQPVKQGTGFFDLRWPTSRK